MKNLIPSIVLIFFIQTLNAQNKSSDTRAANLKGKIKQVITYFYENNGHYNLDTIKSTQKEIDTFNSDGFYIKKVLYNISGSISQLNVYHYVNDTLTTEDQYDSNSKLMLTYSYKYNIKYQLTECDMLFPYMPASNGTVIFYKYNAKGKMVKFDQYDSSSNRLMIADSIIYNRAPQIIENFDYQYEPPLTSPPTFEKILSYFDADDRMVKSETCDHSGAIVDIVASSYQNIDQNGNWLMQISERKGDFSFKMVIKRKIIYY